MAARGRFLGIKCRAGIRNRAALVGFSIGSETGGSIIAPSMRCGVTGLRPTYGRVPRTGAMTLCWTLDKLGPMTRSVEDTLLVLQAISGPDAGDLASVPSHLDFDANGMLVACESDIFPSGCRKLPLQRWIAQRSKQWRKPECSRWKSRCRIGPTIHSI